MIWRLRAAITPILVIMLSLPGHGQDTPKTALNPREAPAVKAQSGWEATGTLLEACSCSVPCPCNFGQGPSQSYCHTVYAYKLKAGRYENVTLDGLVFGGGEADKGVMGFLDSRATPTQKAALQKLALAVFSQGGASPGPRTFQVTRISTADDGRRFHVEFGESGGFEADVLFGRDRKKPIVVENNTTWPVSRFIKGKTTRFEYKDTVGNHLQLDGVNANLGEFHLSSAETSGGEKSGSR